MGQVTGHSQPRKVLKATDTAPKKGDTDGNEEQPNADRKIACVIGAKAGYRVLKTVMQPFQQEGQCPLLLWRREDMGSAERDCPGSLGFQVSNEVNVPELAYHRQVGQKQDGGGPKMMGGN